MNYASLMLWLFVGPTGIYLFDFFCVDLCSVIVAFPGTNRIVAQRKHCSVSLCWMHFRFCLFVCLVCGLASQSTAMVKSTVMVTSRRSVNLTTEVNQYSVHIIALTAFQVLNQRKEMNDRRK